MKTPLIIYYNYTNTPTHTRLCAVIAQGRPRILWKNEDTEQYIHGRLNENRPMIMTVFSSTYRKYVYLSYL